MKLKALIAIFLCAWLASCSGGGQPAGDTAAQNGTAAQEAAPAGDGEEIIATVNGSPITRATLEDQVVMAAPGGGDGDDGLRREILSGLIGVELALQEAMKGDYAPSDKELDDMLASLRNENENEEGEGTAGFLGQDDAQVKEELRRTITLKNWLEREFFSAAAAGGDVEEADRQVSEALERRIAELEKAADIQILDPALKRIMDEEPTAAGDQDAPAQQ